MVLVVDRDFVGEVAPRSPREPFKHGVGGVQHRDGVNVVVVAQQLQRELAGRRGEPQHAVDVRQHQLDELLDGLLSEPPQRQTEAFGVQRVGDRSKRRAVNVGSRVTHAPRRVGERLVDDVGRVHVDGPRLNGHVEIRVVPGFAVTGLVEAEHYESVRACGEFDVQRFSGVGARQRLYVRDVVPANELTVEERERGVFDGPVKPDAGV